MKKKTVDNRNKLKILQVNNSMDIGGIETFIMNLYRNIDRNKYDFVFLTGKPGKYDYQEEVEKMGGRFIRIDQPRAGKRMAHLLQLNNVIKSEKPDVVHCYTYFDAASVMLAAKYNKVPIRITHSHTTQGFGLRRKALHRILASIIRNNSTTLLACGNEAGMALYKKPCFRVLNNGIDLRRFEYNETKRKEKRVELGLDKNDIVIGHIGRFAEVKNHVFMIKLAKKLKENGLMNYKFVFIGDGPLKKEIEKAIKENDLQNNVIVLGNRSDVSDLYNAFDMFIFPSLYEGMPMALIEAQANGLTIVASNNVPAESKINDNVVFVELNKGVDYWANIIKNSSVNRVLLNSRIKEYSIEKTVSEISRLYDGEVK